MPGDDEKPPRVSAPVARAARRSEHDMTSRGRKLARRRARLHAGRRSVGPKAVDLLRVALTARRPVSWRALRTLLCQQGGVWRTREGRCRMRSQVRPAANLGWATARHLDRSLTLGLELEHDDRALSENEAPRLARQLDQVRGWEGGPVG